MLKSTGVWSSRPGHQTGGGRTGGGTGVWQTRPQTGRSSAYVPSRAGCPRSLLVPSPAGVAHPFAHRCAATHSSCCLGGCGPEAASAGSELSGCSLGFSSQPRDPHLALQEAQEAVTEAAKPSIDWPGEFLAAEATATDSPFPAGVHGHGRPEAGPA